MQRLSERSGVYVHAHKLRHTFATRAVDIGTPIFHLQQFLGHQSIEMVRRYYTADQRAALQSYARLVASSPL
jgi:integrase